MWPHYLAAALAYRGHLREAHQTDRRVLLDPAASRWGLFMDQFLDLALLGIVPDSMAGPVSARALEPTAPWDSEFGFTPRHLRGIPWWLAHRDTASLTTVRRPGCTGGPRGPNPPLVVLRARLLGATSTAYSQTIHPRNRNPSARTTQWVYFSGFHRRTERSQRLGRSDSPGSPKPLARRLRRVRRVLG